jgi:thiol:disulfide interchange protein DsbD
MRSAGDQIGWGFQLQAPEMVLGLIILFFVLALNMSGLYEIGTSLQRFGGIDGAFGRWSSLLSGALVTIIATPCTAPFMGAAIGFSIGQGAVSSMLTFLALGVGMATPYVIISLWPGLFVWVPKPGAWMSTFKNLLSVPLYLTVIWLIWVLGQQTTIHTISKVLVVLVFVGLSVWAIGKLQYRTITRIVPWRILIAISLLVSLSGLIHIGTALDQASTREVSKPEWKPWSSGDVASAREEAHPVFVDYTAAWCITCQVNKALVLNDQEVVDTFKKNKVITFRADWTSRDAAITESLTSFGRSGVPVYVFYPANQGAPVVLSEVLRKKEIFNLFDR